MIMETETKQILHELKSIRADLDYLKKHVVDLDIIMTDEDWESIRQAEKDHKAGKTKRLI